MDIEKWALKNAIEHEGKSLSGAVISKLLSEHPELKPSAGELVKEVAKICLEINKLTIEQQLKKLNELAPELLERKEKKEEEHLPPLPNAEMEKVATAFPPEPSKYAHIGHAKSIFVNHEYARRYNGKFILRFEDTNPEKADPKYYSAMLEDLEWLGVKPDEVYYMSDHFDEYYGYMEKLVKDGNAYVCTCPAEKVKEYRWGKIDCECRKTNSSAENLLLWKKMFTTFKEGEAILRLRGNMNSADSAMRDPTLARIIDKKHPRTKKNYKVYPNYDLPAAVEDRKITHRVRSKEFEARKGIQTLIRDYLGFKHPWIFEQARFSIDGTPTQGREIRKLIEEKKVTGWDDIRLATLRALRRRGILPEAIKEFSIETGLSNSESVHSWETLYSFNRRLLDKDAERYFLIRYPVKMTVKGAEKLKVKAKLHPEKKEYRTIETDGKFYVDKEDVKSMRVGKIVRLKDACNVKITKKGSVIQAEIVNDKIKDYPKIHWVPFNDNIKVKLLVGKELLKYRKSLYELDCAAEKNISKIKIGEIVQFERVGFCKKESKDLFIFSHN